MTVGLIASAALALFIIYAALFFATEQIQQYLYDQVVTGLWWRAMVSATPLAVLLVAHPMRMDTMFTEQFGWTVLQALSWFAVLWIVCRYLVPHALLVGVVLFVTLAPLTTMAVDSLASRMGLSS